jgi:hypothetical protein
MDLQDGHAASQTPTTANRRHHPRYDIHVQIELHQEGVDVPMRLETNDLSLSGCYILNMMPFAVGARLRATLWLDGSPMVVQASIATCHPHFGNGIMFEKFEGDSEQKLKNYLENIP